MDSKSSAPNGGFSYRDEAPPPYSANSLSASTLPNSNVCAAGVYPVASELVLSTLNEEIIPRLHPTHSPMPSVATMVLIPSDVSALQSSSASDSKHVSSSLEREKLVGFPTSGNPILIRLSDHNSNSDFWRQSAALTELRLLLQAHFKNLGYELHETGQHPEDRGQRSAVPSRDFQALVSVEMKSVCLRVENDIGLYEARNGPAVVVSTRVGSGNTCLR